MSASLVGSEMCIRDSRAQGTDTKPCRTSRDQRSPRGRRATARALRTSVAPVSYTHLTLPTICSV
eukprot:8763297-Alexandrium_andersonii.AAC.1